MRMTMRFGASIMAVSAALGTMAIVAPASAQAQETQTLGFDIPSGDLATALKTFAEQSDRSVLFTPEMVAGRTSQGVRGKMSEGAALGQLLAGTGLQFDQTATGGFSVRSASTAPQPISADGEVRSDDADTVVVTGTAVSHLADRNRTGTRMDADPLTVPLSVSTVSEDLIKRQQALSLGDAAGNVVGVTPGTQGSFQMRGFGANIMRNGTLGATGTSNNLPIVAVSRIEVVKGPEAIIAGLDAGYGGVVNVITKTPPEKSTAEIEATVGSRGYYDVGFDVGGPLNEDGTILARLVASTQNSDKTNAGYEGASSDYIAPSVTFRMPSWGTELTAQYEYQNVHRAPDTIVFGRPGDTKLSDDLRIVQFGPSDLGTDIEARTTTIALEQRITDNWSAAIRYSEDKQLSKSHSGGTFLFEPFILYPEVPTLVFDGETEGNVKSISYELKGEFDTGPIAHKLLVAYDDRDKEILLTSGASAVWVTNIETGANADDTATWGPFFGAPSTPFSGGSRPTETGILVMDQMTWGDWVVLGGWRRIKYDFQQINGPDVPQFEEDLPSLGIVYRMSPTLSFYANASKGFEANQGLFTVSGDPVAPENAQQFEVGAKALLMDNQIAATVALFKIDQKNVAAPDQDNPWPQTICLGPSQVCYITVPGVQSEGVEVEVSGHILPRLEVRAAYTYVDKTFDPLFQENTQFVPHQGTVWATYNFGDGELGWWAGGGLQIRGERSPTADSLDNPGQVRVDLSAGYDAKRWSFVMGIKNVTDERLYDAFSGAFGTGTVVQPREFYATVRHSF